jgi:hypothetical protein
MIAPGHVTESGATTRRDSPGVEHGGARGALTPPVPPSIPEGVVVRIFSHQDPDQSFVETSGSEASFFAYQVLDIQV